MDIVITYVNSADPVWQAQYAAATNEPIEPERYRDWGFLPYLFRGIERYMPFVEKVFLVVSTVSQVPEWVDRERVQIVEHKDIIPAQFLPTFNSSAIELYLHRIKNLGEQFIYFNDDCYPVRMTKESDFFIDNKIVMNFRFRPVLLHMNSYKKRRQLSDIYARKVAGKRPLPKFCYFVPLHSCSPMIKSSQQEAFALIKEEIEQHITPFRSEKIVNQYFYSDYLFYTNGAINKKGSFRYCAMAKMPLNEIVRNILHPDKDIICVNDIPAATSQKELLFNELKATFDKKFPTKSKYEKKDKG